ncbi:fibronectin type III domain-containing protein [Candidatus Peregrinibacteria bacterium]|nr:fibronectin type III domain-containing protein [Candidatus Peregrinibacteria bacterium]
MKKLYIFLSALMIALNFMAPAYAFAQGPVDITSPSDVEALKAVPGDSFVSLQWDKATDNISVVGYKVYYGKQSVTKDNTVRYEKTIDVGNVLEYPISGLDNGARYYFAVTAYDKAGNESEYFSPEVSSSPMAGLVGALTSFPQAEGDKAVLQDESKILKISKTEAVDAITVKVIFSASITLPEKDITDYFTIVDNQTLESLEIKSVALDAEDKEGKTILIETEIQIPETEYLFTIGNALVGKNGEIVVSGKDDTASFKGSAAEHIVAPSEETKIEQEKPGTENGIVADSHAAAVKTDVGTETLQLKSITPVDETTIKILFNKNVTLKEDPTQNFEIIEKNAPDKKLEIQEIKLEDNKITVTIKTAKPENKIYLLTVKDITDEAGALIDENANKLEFNPLIPDTTPPEDVTDFIPELIKNTIVKLSWIASINSAGDLVDQILYKSMNRGETYSKLKSLGVKPTEYNVGGLVPGKEYYFKLTVKDKTGNESAGVVASSGVIPGLPATGPAGILVLALGSAGVALMRKFRK